MAGDDSYPTEGNIQHMRPLKYQLDLLLHLVKRDFLLRYKRSALGILWSLLVPLAQLLVLTFIFTKIVPLNIKDYPAFLFSALLPWTWFSTCLGSAGRIFYDNRDLMFQPNFDPFVLVVVNTLSNLLIYLAALPILTALLLWCGRFPTGALSFWPFLLLIQGLLTMGLSLIIATLNVFYRDVEHSVGIALLLLFYMTPVFYGADAISGPLSMVYTINPIAGLITQYREIFFLGRNPDMVSFGSLSLFSLFMAVMGYTIYRRQLPRVIDEI